MCCDCCGTKRDVGEEDGLCDDCADDYYNAYDYYEDYYDEDEY